MEQKPSRLLQLPSELRLSILEHLFAEDHDPIAVGLPSAPWQGKPQRYHPPISEVCNTLREESLPLFYEDRGIVLLLRFREGRAQGRHWIREVYSNPAICTRVRNVRLQYFEEPYRSTAVDLDMQDLAMRNKNSWLHPLTGRPLRLLGQIETALSEERMLPHASHADKATLLEHLIMTMTAPLKMSRLMRQESMVNLRLHGYTDFELRFECYHLERSHSCNHISSSIYVTWALRYPKMMHQGTIYPSSATCIRPLFLNNELDNVVGPDFRPIDGSVRRCHTSNLEAAIVTHVSQRKSRRMAPSRLLALPAELRLEIWEYALQEQQPLGAGGSYNLSILAPKIFGGDAAKQGTQPGLTQVSRQLRAETLALFYRLNTLILAVHYRRARAEVDRWIELVSSQPTISTNLRTVTIKHRFGILDFRGTIEFDLQNFVIVGPKLWYNAIPPLIRKEVESIVDEAHAARQTHDVTVGTLKRLVEVLGVEPPSTSL